jgi:hypothetical protein
MAKFIIYLTGPTFHYGYQRGPFLWSEPHKAFLFDGKIYDEQTFNSVVNKILLDHADDHPQIRVVEFSEAPAAVQPAPVATITAHEVTADEAEAVLKRLAPELMKKKATRNPVDSLAI